MTNGFVCIEWGYDELENYWFTNDEDIAKAWENSKGKRHSMAHYDDSSDRYYEEIEFTDPSKITITEIPLEDRKDLIDVSLYIKTIKNCLKFSKDNINDDLDRAYQHYHSAEKCWEAIVNELKI